jgi:hypothetical protein
MTCAKCHQRTSNQIIPTLSESSGVWLACRCEHGWPSHLVSSVAHEALSPFADRAINAVDRIGRLALGRSQKIGRSHHPPPPGRDDFFRRVAGTLWSLLMRTTRQPPIRPHLDFHSHRHHRPPLPPRQSSPPTTRRQPPRLRLQLRRRTSRRFQSYGKTASSGRQQWRSYIM